MCGLSHGGFALSETEAFHELEQGVAGGISLGFTVDLARNFVASVDASWRPRREFPNRPAILAPSMAGAMPPGHADAISTRSARLPGSRLRRTPDKRATHRLSAIPPAANRTDPTRSHD